MASKALAILLLSLAFNKAYTSPVAQCPSAQPSAPSAPADPEVYLQNNGQPLVIYAEPVEDNSDSANSILAPSGPSCSAPAQSPAPCAQPQPSPPAPCAQPQPSAPAPCAQPQPSAPAPCADSGASDLATAQQLADQSIADASQSGQETIPASNTPCRTETATEIIQEADETIVHQPGPIYVNQPPTRLVINHAPFLIRPSAVVLQQGGKKITKQITTNFMGSPVQVRPVIVRIVKPITRKVLVEKPDSGCGQQVVVPPPQPDQCASVMGSAPSASASSCGCPAAPSCGCASAIPASAIPASAAGELQVPSANGGYFLSPSAPCA